MRAQSITKDLVRLQLTPDEYLLLARSLFFLFANGTLSQADEAERYGSASASDFVYGLLVAEQDARREGIDWLPTYEADDQTMLAEPVHDPKVRFHQRGVELELSADQVRLVSASATDVATRIA
jgi:hypothetical protein